MPHDRVGPVKFLVIHHSAANDEYTHIDDLIAERKRRNEGYNFIIDDVDVPDNHRALGVQDVPDNEVSNGVYGLNDESENVCVNGNFELKSPTDDEVNELVQWLAVKAKKLGWRRADVARIIGHQEAGEHYARERYVTACPGKYMIALIPHIRARVAIYLPV